jgi:hypothetical protein
MLVAPLVAPLLAVAGPSTALAAAAGTAGNADAPSVQTLTAMKAQALAVQAQLIAGTKTLEAARATLSALQAKAAAATTGVATVKAELVGLRTELGTYAADLYVHPSGQLALTMLASQGDVAASIRGVEMLSIVNRGRADVLRLVVVKEQRVEILQTQAAQSVAAAAVAQKSVTAQVTALQLKAARANVSLSAAQAAYQAELLRVAAARLAAAKAARDKVARALAERRAAALRAEATAPTAVVGSCDATSRGPYPAGPWGGYSDGLIPASQLCAIIGGGRLRPDAAEAFNAMSRAYAATFGGGLCVSDSYRSYSEQVAVYRQRPRLAAVPGTSNHGWGLAVDLGCGVERYGSAQYRWMTANAGRFGFVHPAWALRRPFEPWHWEFGHLPDSGGT